MAHPFAPMPTLREFIDAAVSQGCREGVAHSKLVGPHGPTEVRYLEGTNKVIYPFPNIKDDDRLTSTLMASVVRALKLRGFDDLLGDLV